MIAVPLVSFIDGLEGAVISFLFCFAALSPVEDVRFKFK